MIPSKIVIFAETTFQQISKSARRLVQIIPAVIILLIPCIVKASVIPAANDSVGAVQTAINTAQSGDEVSVPAGTAYWNTNLVINNNISLVGAGVGQTIIIDEVPRANFRGLIQWNTISNYTQCEVSGFQFQGGKTNTASEIGSEVTFNGYCPVCHVTSCLFQDLFASSVWFAYGAYGCVDHCQFLTTNWQDQIYCENGQLGGLGLDAQAYGDVMWATPPQYGSTTNWIYIEANQFSYPSYPNGYVDDAAQGSKVVFRYNSVTNMQFQDHGTESSQRYRGGRAFEIYGNFFVNNSPLYTNSGTVIYLRSGSGVIFSNTFVGFGGMTSLNNFRATQDYFPWGGANGQNPWDTNNATLIASGTHTGASGSYYLQDANATWTIGQWVGGENGNTGWCYEVQDVTQGGGATQPAYSTTPNFGIISSNGVHEIYATYSANNGPIKWNAGDSYRIYQSYAQLDQLGRGSGDLLEDNSWGSGLPVDSVTGKTNWPNEVSEPIYQWGNTFDGHSSPQIGANIFYVNNGSADGAYGVIIDGRDYFDNVARPGYTPLPFPHFLDTTNGVTTPPSNFALTVVNGAGSGSYAQNQVVNISANQTSNQNFLYWSGADIANTNLANTTVTMPGADLTVTAIYSPNPGGPVQYHSVP